jgi:tetratricopeptide (TPR) repeat protein
VQGWDAASRDTIVSTKLDGEMADLFALQDRVSDSVSHGLGYRAAEKPVSDRRPTRNANAYELYLRATERLRRLNRWDTLTAIEMLQQATRLDPQFAEAWARLAEACVTMGGTFEPVRRWIQMAGRAADRALHIDRINVDALVARGRALWTPTIGYQNRPALRALSSALRLNSGAPGALVWRGLLLLHVGLMDRALVHLHEALSIQPDDSFTLTFIGQAQNYLCEYAKSRDYYDRTLAADPASLWANLFSPGILVYGGWLDDAEARIRVAEQLYPGDPLLIASEALLWVQRGEVKKAEQLAKRTFRGAKSKLHTHHAMHMAAAAYSLLGKPAEAVKLLSKASKTGLPNYPAFRDDPFLQKMAAFVPYKRLLVSLRRDWEAYKREFGRN